MRPHHRWFPRIGPGIITGAADNDPSGITTMSQAGAQYGYALLWPMLFELPLLAAVQEACARIGAVTGRGIAAVIGRRYPRPVLVLVVVLIATANTINVGADLGAMAAATRLLVPVPFFAGATAAAVIVVVLELALTYRTYASILRWLSLSVLLYAAVALIVQEPWGEILRATFLPQLQPSFEFFYLVTGILGTTISPYMFFWQASEEVEEELLERRLRARGRRPRIDRRFIRHIGIDTTTGMFVSLLTSWFIVVATATVLHKQGVYTIRSAADAARALEPLVQTFPHAGLLAKSMFAAGVVGLGLLGIPVLAGSTSYAVAEALQWREGLAQRVREAPGFYGTLAASTLVGLLMNLIGLDPVGALIFAAVCNGVAAVPLLFLIGRVAGDEAVMGEYRSRRLSRTLVTIAFLAMGASAVAMLGSVLR